MSILLRILVGFSVSAGQRVSNWKTPNINLNCYTDNSDGTYYGATDILPDPWTQANGNIEECKRVCLNNTECKGIIWRKSDTTCHLRKNIRPSQCKQTYGHTLYEVKDNWKTPNINLNCYTDDSDGTYYGAATDILPDPWTQANGNIEVCKRVCLNITECKGIIWRKSDTTCHFKTNIRPSQCKQTSGHTLYEVKDT